MKRLIVRLLVPFVGVVALLVAAGLAWHLREHRTTYYTDADTIRKEEGEAELRDVLWQPAEILPPQINTAREEYEPRLSHDGMTLFFARGRAGENADLFTSTRTARGWSDPRPLTSINTAADELGPEPSPDGERLYFYSNRGGGHGGYDLWVARRGDDGAWGAPENLGGAINSRYNEYGPCLDPKAPSLLYFVSNRPKPDDVNVPESDAPASRIREDMADRDYDVYITMLGDETVPVTPVAALNSPHDEGGPAVSPSGDFIYFSSDRPGGLGGFDIYRSRRLRGAHLAPRNLGDTLNTAANEVDPSVTLGGFGLHFSSNRVVGVEPAAGTPEAGPEIAQANYDVYFAASREVFSETASYRAAIDWAALWADLWPYLLFLLLALLLLLALMHAARRHRLGTLSLLMRCLLASLLAHVLLMALFSIWEVTTAIADAIEGRGMRVRLTSPSVGGQLAAQVRSGLTDIEIRSDVLEEASRATESVEAARADARTVTSAASASERIEASASSAVATEVADATAEAAAAAAPSDAIASVAPSAVSLDTPEPPARVQVDATNARPADALPTPSASRAETNATGEPVPRSGVAIAPAASDSAEATATSVVDVGSAARDADTSHTQGRENAVPMAVVEGMDTLDLALPADARSSQAEAVESERSIIAEAAASPRQTTTSTRRPRPEAAPYVSAAPGRATPEAPSLAEAGGSEARDADAAPASEPAASSRSTATLADLSVDALEAAVPALETGDATATAAADQGDAVPRLTGAPRAANMAGSTTETPAPITQTTAMASGAASKTPALRAGSLAASSAPDAGDRAPGTPGIPSVSDVQIPELQTPLPALADGGAPAAGESVAAVDESLTAPRGASGRVLAFAATIRAPTVAPPGGGGPASDALALADTTLAATDARTGASGSSIHLAPDAAAPLPGALESALPRLEEAAPRDARAADRTGAAASGPSKQKRADAGDILPRPGAGPSPPPVAFAPGRTERPASRSLADRSARQQEVVAPEPRRPDRLAAASVDVMPIMPLDVKLPEGRKNPFPQRAPEVRREYIEKFGGSMETEKAVALALSWLARHQSSDGRWDSNGFDEDCGECEGPGRMSSDIALTGLGLLCFLAADHSHVKEGPYRDVVEGALRWLLAEQGSDGSLMRDESMYSHGIATMALAEAMAMTGDPRLDRAVQAAVDFIYEARNRRIGGWRYDPGQVGDTSVTGWQVMGLISARRAGSQVPQEALEVAGAWLDLVSRRSRPGLYAYQPGKRFSPAMTAEGMYVRQLLGRSRGEPDMQAGAEFLLDNLPDWSEDPNTYYWYYGTLALFQHGGEAWDQWNESVVEVLLERQVQGGRAAGSWPVEGQWSRIGGRVYQTAICCLTLEVYYRYLPLYVLEELADAE